MRLSKPRAQKKTTWVNQLRNTSTQKRAKSMRRWNTHQEKTDTTLQQWVPRQGRPYRGLRERGLRELNRGHHTHQDLTNAFFSFPWSERLKTNTRNTTNKLLYTSQGAISIQNTQKHTTQQTQIKTSLTKWEGKMLNNENKRNNALLSTWSMDKRNSFDVCPVLHDCWPQKINLNFAHRRIFRTQFCAQRFETCTKLHLLQLVDSSDLSHL